jgi:hypothetical protein
MSQDTRKKVFLLLKEGHARSRVAKVLKVSPQTVHYHTQRLLSEGYLRPVRGCKSPILYEATSKPYPEDHRGWSEVTQVRAHHTSRLFKVTHPPKRAFPFLWDKSWEASGVRMHLARGIIITTREGPVKVKALRWVEDKSLTVWLDNSTLITGEQVLAHEDTATETAILVAREVQRATGMVLGLPEVMQDTHYAIPLPPDVWIDRSLGSPEVETTKKGLASSWADLDTIIQGLRDEQEALANQMMDLVGLIEANHKAIETLSKVLRPPQPPPDDGVGYI